jgi:hypothetical protein
MSRINCIYLKIFVYLLTCRYLAKGETLLATNWDEKFFESTRGRCAAVKFGTLWQRLRKAGPRLRADIGSRRPVPEGLRTGVRWAPGCSGRAAWTRGIGGSTEVGRSSPGGGQDRTVAGVLNELGTLAELEEEDDTLLIQGYGCLLAAVTLDHPAVSALAEALVAEVAGVPVHERCDRSEGPRCCIEVASADEVTQRSVSLLGTFRYSGGPIWRLSSYLGFDPFRGIPHKEGIRVQREHQVQGTTRVHFPCYLQRPHDALGPHEQRRGTCRVPIYLDTNSYHSNPPSTSDALYVPFTPLLLHIGNSGA